MKNYLLFRFVPSFSGQANIVEKRESPTQPWNRVRGVVVGGERWAKGGADECCKARAETP